MIRLLALAAGLALGASAAAQIGLPAGFPSQIMPFSALPPPSANCLTGVPAGRIAVVPAGQIAGVHC